MRRRGGRDVSFDRKTKKFVLGGEFTPPAKTETEEPAVGEVPDQEPITAAEDNAVAAEQVAAKPKRGPKKDGTRSRTPRRSLGTASPSPRRNEPQAPITAGASGQAVSSADSLDLPPGSVPFPVASPAVSFASMETDVVTRVIAIAALVIAIGDVLVTWALWSRSGPRMKVILRRVEHPSDRLRDKLVVEVANVGRMPMLVKEIGLEDRVSTGSGSNPQSYLSLPLVPTEGQIPRILEPTDLPIVAEATAEQIIERWAPGRTLTLVAWAKDGNDGKRSSRQLRFTTPRQP